MGPGKPYWKTPAGLTSGLRSLSGVGTGAGIGGDGDVRLGEGNAVGVGDSLR